MKHYPYVETARYKCFGSGSINEAFAPDSLRELIPSVLYNGSVGSCDVTVLEWRSGRHLSARGLDERRAVEAGRVLGRIHAVEGPHFGSLDGTHGFTTQEDAFEARWAVAMRLLSSVDAGLAAAADRWARARMAELDSVAPARLVHGDYGLTNLLWRHDGGLGTVLDWEHARYGDPYEDWAKILLSCLFPEPNGFGMSGPCASLLAGWQSVVGDLTIVKPALELYLVYIASTLGVFLGGGDRLAWVRSEVLGGGT